MCLLNSVIAIEFNISLNWSDLMHKKDVWLKNRKIEHSISTPMA